MRILGLRVLHKHCSYNPMKIDTLTTNFRNFARTMNIRNIFTLLIGLCALCARVSGSMIISITSVPQLTPMFDNLYIAGTVNDWVPSDSQFMLESSDGNWSIALEGIDGEAIQFKFLRDGAWDTVEGNTLGGYIENRSAIFQNGETLELTIEGWEDIAGSHTVTSHVRIVDSDFYIPQLDRSRRIWIALPEDYYTSALDYPVMYLHDGQNLFDLATSFAGEWEADESLIGSSVPGCRPYILIGIDNGGVHRIDEYAPWINIEYSEGGEGILYSSFVINTLKPFIDANFRTLPQREHTAVGGSSLGALISMYMFAAHNDIFSKVGLFSPAFWFNEEIFDFTASQNFGTDNTVFMSGGTSESAGMVSGMEQMNETLLSSGLSNGALQYLVVAGGQHNEQQWASTFDDCLAWLNVCLVSIDDTPSEKNLPIVYPNPSVDSIYVNPSGHHISDLTIYSSDGRECLRLSNIQESGIDISFLPSGNYVVRIIYFQGQKSLVPQTIDISIIKH